MAKSAHPIDHHETLPMAVQNMTFMIDRLHKDCSPLQFLRELTQNALEAIQALPDPKGQVIWDVDWNRYDLTSVRKLAVIDTGIGMTGEEMLRYIRNLSSSMREQSLEGNFGVGAKIAAVPRNHAGLVYLSWKDGVGYMIHVWRDPEKGYGLRKFERPDGTAEYWTKVEDTIKPESIKDHGTMVILLGTDLKESTIQAPPGAPMPSRWILRYLNSRYYRFLKGITVSAREGWDVPRSDGRHNFLRTVTGMKPWLDGNASDSGVVALTGAKAHWWILNESLDLDSGHYVSGGHVAALYQEELYELQTGRAGVSRLQAFGVIFGYSRVVIYVEPKGNGENHLTSNTARTALLLNDEPLPWVDWATEFRESMPEPIKKLVEEVGASSVGHDHRASIRERLKQIMDLFRMSRYRPSPTSKVAIEEAAEGLGGVPRQGEGSGGGGGKTSGSAGGRAGDIYALFQAPVGNPGEEIRTHVPDPKTQWVSATDGTRTPPALEDRAANYLPDQNLLLINADFRVFTDMVDRWCKRYAHAPGARSVVESVVREWFEQQLIEAVMGALALRGSSLWTMQDRERMWNEEALTAVVLPRYHIDVSVRRTLGAKLGSLKEHVA